MIQLPGCWFLAWGLTYGRCQAGFPCALLNAYTAAAAVYCINDLFVAQLLSTAMQQAFSCMSE
jgi:hypothetical protein